MADVSAEPSEWLWMYHPETGGRQYVPRTAFEIYHEPKGWKEIDEAAAQASEILDRPVEDVASLSAADLKIVASRTGKTVSGSPKKDDLVDLIKSDQES